MTHILTTTSMTTNVMTDFMKLWESLISEGDAGGAAAGSDAGGGAVAGGDVSSASGISSSDVLGDGCNHCKDGYFCDGCFHKPCPMPFPFYRWSAPANGGSKRKKTKKGKKKKYAYEKGMKVITSYNDLVEAEEQKSSSHVQYVYNIPISKVQQIVDNSDVQNKRFNINQFLKYDGQDVECVGAFRDFPNDCLALAVLQYVVTSQDDCYICEIQSFQKGYGEKLLQKILKQQQNVWLMANATAESTLLDFYRKPVFQLSELVIENSIYDGKSLHIFFTKTLDEDTLRRDLEKHFKRNS